MVIVGAGHNGLVCACYLAQGGPQGADARAPAPWSAARPVTEEFHPGFRNSVAAYTVSLLQAKVIRDLRLAGHGLRIVERPLSNFLPLEAGYLKVGGGLEATQREFAKFSARDAKSLPHYWAKLERVADVLRDAVLETPPNVGGGVRDLLGLFRSGLRIKKLSTRSATRPARAIHRAARPNGWRTGSSRIRSRRRSASMRWSAISPARTTRAPPTCCCTTASAR